MRIEYSWDRGQSDCAHGSVTATYSAALHFLTKFDWPRDLGYTWHSFNGWIMQPDPLSGLDVIMIIIINGPLAALIGQNMRIRTFPLKCKYGRRTLITIHWSLIIWGQCVTWLAMLCLWNKNLALKVPQEFSGPTWGKIPKTERMYLISCRFYPCSGTVPEKKFVCHIFGALKVKLHFYSIDMCSQISTWSADLARARIMISITHKVPSLSIQR